MLIKPINSILKERKNKEALSYLGTVEDNNDPEKLARLKVRIEPYSDLKTKELPWVCPLLGSHGNSSSAGGFNIPEIGSQVRVTFPSQDMTAPYYSGAELNELNRVTLFDEDYPNAYGYKDSNGNYIRVNKKSGVIDARHESSTNMEITPDGTVNVYLRGGSSFSFSSYNTATLDLQGARITADGNMGSINMESIADITLSARSITLDSENVSITGSLSTEGANGVLWLMNGMAVVKDGLIVSISGIGGK